MKTKAAQANGVFKDEFSPVTYKTRKGEEDTVVTDEHPRLGTTLNVLEGLRPLFPDESIDYSGKCFRCQRWCSTRFINERREGK